MGLYDTIFIEYPLPIPEYIPSKFRSFIHSTISQDGFQTKDLDQTLDDYFISNDGRFYSCNYLNFDSPEISNYEPMYMHGHIKVHTIVRLDEESIYITPTNSFRLEYDLKFTDSLLISSTLLSPTIEDMKSYEQD